MPNPRGRPIKEPDADFNVEEAVAEASAAADAESKADSLRQQLEVVSRLRGKAEKDRSWGAATALLKLEQDAIRKLRYELWLRDRRESEVE